MFRDTYLAVCNAAGAKLALLKKNPLGFFVSSMVAGMFISFGSFLSMSVGGYATAGGCSVTKLLTALTFAAALSLVIMAGCELFTGNNLVLTAAILEKKATWGQACKLWGVCWVGNFVGSWIMVLLFHLSGTGQGEAVAAFFASTAAAKVAIAPVQMVIWGILCNICVCLAVWCATKMQNECAKLVMVIWCILIFMVCGFEHSIANMSIIAVGLLNPVGQSIPVSGYILNLVLVTIGNMIGGGLFVALPYYIIGKEKQ